MRISRAGLSGRRWRYTTPWGLVFWKQSTGTHSCANYRSDDLSAQTEVEIHIPYKDISAGKHRLDLIVEQRVIVELKAIAAIAEIHTAQTISYLKATGLEVALIVNFGSNKLTWKRLVRSRGRQEN